MSILLPDNISTYIICVDDLIERRVCVCVCVRACVRVCVCGIYLCVCVYVCACVFA